MGLFDFLFGKKKATLEAMDKKNDAFLSKNPVAADEENEMMRTASKLMTSRKFDESLELYKRLVEQYPAKRGLYESQIGVAYFFMGKYETAFTHYVSAMNNGGDKSMMDDNIWEAAEAYSKSEAASQGSSTAHPLGLIKEYMELFPKGNHAKKAATALAK